MKLINLPGNSTYLIDTKGNVYSPANHRTSKTKQTYGFEGQDYIKMSNWYDKDGYARVTLTRQGDQGLSKHIAVHRALAVTFIPNPENKPMVRHLDDDKTNNDISNLAWGTHEENTEDARINGRLKYVDKSPIIELLEQGLRGQEIVRAIGASAATVSRTTKKWLASKETNQ
jgi:HNH endonuclease